MQTNEESVKSDKHDPPFRQGLEEHAEALSESKY